MLQQHFIIEGKYLGTANRSLQLRGKVAMAPDSFAFACPVCGEVWARAVVEGSPFFFFTKPCRKHTQGSFVVPGSLWLPLDDDFNSILPKEVLMWELDRHLDFAERTST